MKTLLMIACLLWIAQLNVAGQSRLSYSPTAEDCCFSFGYSMLSNDQTANVLDIFLEEEVSWAGLELNLGAGWRIVELLGQNGFSLYRSDDEDGNLEDLPISEDDLFTACFQQPVGQSQLDLRFQWRKNGQLRASEALRLQCGKCTPLLDFTATCLENGGYVASFRFVNLSAYPMDQLRIYEVEETDVIVQESWVLSSQLQPGDTSEVLPLDLNLVAENFSELCFYLSGSRLENGLRLDCCTALQCVELPACDRCCSAFDDFVAEAEQGFTINYLNTDTLDRCFGGNLLLSANALTDCDIATYELINLDRGVMALSASLTGNDSLRFEMLDSATYSICMTVERLNLSGENCYESNSIQLCDTVLNGCVGFDYLAAATVWSIYPNPVRETLYISGEEGLVAYALYDLSGRLLFNDEPPSGSSSLQINLRGQPPGLYLLVLYDRHWGAYRQRVLVR